MDSKITIRTNRHWRNLTYGYELTAKERADFDYIDPDAFDFHDFLRYRGEIYDISEFTWIAPGSPFPSGWSAYLPDSFFSGLVIILDPETGDRAQVGTYFS